MKQIIKKGSFLTLMFMLLGSLSLYAADNDLITRQITIKLEKAGTLPDRITSSKKYKITNLKIIGEINGTDLKMIREMAGGNDPDGRLSVLDLSKAKIVEGGDCYYKDYYTSNDVIGSCAFRDCSRLTSLNLPDGITSIGDKAFYFCRRLTSLNLPDGITSIGRYAFEFCDGLTSLNLPTGITEISEGAFWNCCGLTSLNLPASITKIGKLAFKFCDGLTSLNLSTGITEIGPRAFEGCYRLKEVRFCINDNLDTYLTKGHPSIDVNCGIKYYINDKEITSIEIPSNVTTLGNYVFQGCRRLTSLNLPDGITEISEGAFQGCSGLTSLNLPDGITKIGEGAFWGCSGLTSLNLPDGITKIDDDAFLGCSGLTSLNLPDGITSIGEYAFEGCSGLTSLTLPAGITKIGSEAFKGCSGLTSLNLPDGVTSIYFEAFQGCSGLTSIYLYAEKVPEISNDAFEGFDAKKCTLYVPMGTYDDYWLSNFGDYFEDIVEFDATGIDKTTTSTDVEEVARYSVNGQRLSAPTKGLNIVKYSDGSVKKVAVR